MRQMIVAAVWMVSWLLGAQTAWAGAVKIRELFWKSGEWEMRGQKRMPPEAGDSLEEYYGHEKALIPVLLDYYEEVWVEGGVENWTYTKPEWQGIDKGTLCHHLQAALRAILESNLCLWTDPDVPWGGPPAVFREWWTKYGQYREWREDSFVTERKTVRALRQYLYGSPLEVTAAAEYLDRIIRTRLSTLDAWIHRNIESGDDEKARAAQFGRLCLGEVYGVRVSKHLPPIHLWRRGMTPAEEEAYERANQARRTAVDVFIRRSPVRRWQDIERARVLEALGASTATGLTSPSTGPVP